MAEDKKLTQKQEMFCQAYVRLGDKSAAYREAYDTSKMKPESINEVACQLFNDLKITSRVQELQDEVKKRNDVTVDEVVKTLAMMLRFDIADLYDEGGRLKPLNDIPKEARLMIQQLDTEELYSAGREKELLGFSKKVRTYSKIDAIEKLMKHLGGYEKDNQQSKSAITITIDNKDAQLGS